MAATTFDVGTYKLAAEISGEGSPAVVSMPREGEKLLRKGAYDSPLTDQAQRRALFEGAWLATAAAGRGNLEEACALGRTAVARTATVRSARSLEVLGRLAARLRRAKRNEYVRDFLPSLEACLGRRPAS